MIDQLDTSTPSRRALLAAVGGSALALCLGGCASGQSSNAPAEPATVPVGDVPVGSGIIVGQYVVTQPTAGKFAAFSYLCPHQDLPVQAVTDQAIDCQRHGASFSLADGAVISGPTDRPLSPAPIARSGDTLTVG